MAAKSELLLLSWVLTPYPTNIKTKPGRQHHRAPKYRKCRQSNCKAVSSFGSQVNRSSLQNVRGAKTRYMPQHCHWGDMISLPQKDFLPILRTQYGSKNHVLNFDHAHQYHCTVSLKTGAKTNSPFSCSDTADANCKVSCTQNLSLRYGETEYQPR